MAEKKRIEFSYVVHGSWSDLVDADQELLTRALQAARGAYAPYSKFLVGAALRKHNGDVVIGSNQENASFPVGICAERTALHAALAHEPNTTVEVMAIVVVDATNAVAPCGICRQALLEQQHRQDGSFRILMGVPQGKVIELSNAGDLLPLAFDPTFLDR